MKYCVFHPRYQHQDLPRHSKGTEDNRGVPERGVNIQLSCSCR